MTYHVTYKIDMHHEGIEKADIPEGHGAADAVAILSLIYPPDGSLSLAIVSGDGRTGESLSDGQLFKAWSLMAFQLSQSAALGPGSRGLCVIVHEAIKRAVLASADESEVKPNQDQSS